MKVQSKSLVAALSAIAMSAAPAVSHGEVIFYLVGSHHIFRIGPDQTFHVQERQDVEQKYAGEIADADAQYKENIAHETDDQAAKETDDFNAYLAKCSDERDQALDGLYERADDVRESHPELQVQGEGPYQVIGIDYHNEGGVMVFDRYCAYAPWPGYVVVGAPVWGWGYGVYYNPVEFHAAYLGWYGHYWVAGGPAFFGFYGVGGVALNIDIAIGIGGRGYAIGHRPLGDFHSFYRDHPGFRPSGHAYDRFHQDLGHPGDRGRTPGREGEHAGDRQGDRGGYGHNDKPSTGGYGNHGDKPATGGYGNHGDKPTTGGYGNHGDKPTTGGYGNHGDKPSTGGYGNHGDKPTTGGYGNHGDKPTTGGYGNHGDKPTTGGYGNHGDKPSTGGYGSKSSTGADTKPSTGGYGSKSSIGADTKPSTGGAGSKSSSGGYGGGAKTSTRGYGSSKTTSSGAGSTKSSSGGLYGSGGKPSGGVTGNGKSGSGGSPSSTKSGSSGSSKTTSAPKSSSGSTTKKKS